MTDTTADLTAQRDGAYRERAQLLAWLAAIVPAVIAPAPDVDEPDWQILYLAPGGSQLSWHIAPPDADLFQHVQHVCSDDPRAQWDGHTTPEKYERIRALMLDALRGGNPSSGPNTAERACLNALLPVPRAEAAFARSADTECPELRVWLTDEVLAIFRFHAVEEIDFDRVVLLTEPPVT